MRKLLNLGDKKNRELIDNAPEPIVVLDVEQGRFVDYNEKALQFFKLRAEELDVKNPMELSPLKIRGLDAPSYAQERIDEALIGGNPVFNWIHLDSENQEIPCEIRLVRVPPYEKLLVRGTIIDKRDEKQIEEALQQSQDRLKLAFQATGLGYFDWKPQTGEVIWDEQMHLIFDLPTDSAVNRNEYFASVLHPDDVLRVQGSMSYLLDPKSGELAWQDEYSIILENGVHHIYTYALLLRDKQGLVERMIGTCQNITERKKAEQELYRTQRNLSEITQRFQLSMEAAQIGIWDWDINKDQFLWDDTMFKIYGLTKEKEHETYQSWTDTVHPEDLGQAEKEVLWALEGRKEFRCEFRIVWPDGSVRTIKALGSVQRDQEGDPVRMVGINWDVTQEREAERQRLRARQLELKNRELEQFAYIASHDLQEPLRTVNSFVGLLRNRYGSQLDESAQVYMQLISDGASRMSRLIKGLLEYSRIGAERELSTIDCGNMIGNILNDLTAQITASGAQVLVEPMPVLEGYETELRVLFQNLISNAIKFRKPDCRPVVQIEVENLGRKWRFCIRDNGIGIETAYQEKIFVIFQRLHSVNEFEGTGIGLAHCQKIVDLHGGKIWVESQKGQGSSFYFTIPSRHI
jgi:PAS domain S-box-containing protein